MSALHLQCGSVGSGHSCTHPALTHPHLPPTSHNMAAMASVARPALGVNTVRSVAPKRAAARSVRTFAVVAEKKPPLGAPRHWLPGTSPPDYLDGTMAGDYGARASTCSLNRRYVAGARSIRVAAASGRVHSPRRSKWGAGGLAFPGI